MIVLDTNVLSAIMHPEPDRPVVEWLDGQPTTSIWTTAVTVFEIRFGIALLPASGRKTLLQRSFDRAISEKIEDRIIPFDTNAAEEAAILLASRQRRGRPGKLRDTMIAGIAIAHRATLATRNTRHFADFPVAVVNPWADD